MIITTASMKGGVGKTTITINIAKILSAILIDCDLRQKSAYLKGKEMGITCTLLPPEKEVDFFEKIKKGSDKDNLIIFDTGGKDTAGSRMAIAVADLVIIPVNYSSLDKRGLEETLDVIKELESYGKTVNYKILLSKVDSRSSNFHHAKKELEKRGLPHYPFCIGLYQSFATSIDQNKTVMEMGDTKAKFCMEQLIREIKRELFSEQNSDFY